MGDSITSTRRYYLMKRRNAAYECSVLENAWQAKQEAEPGTSLPSTFPLRASLVLLGYSTKEDLNGADATELLSLGLSQSDAEAVISAFSAL